MYAVDYARPDFAALKGKFVADMHFHSEYSHDCSTPLVDIVKHVRKAGIAVAITDHNRIGGSLAASRFKDITVIPSIEICSREGKDVIPYFYDVGHLQEFYEKRLAPKLKEKNALRTSVTPFTLPELLQLLAEEQCVVSLPHPFAPGPRHSHKFFEQRHALAVQADAIEAFNATMTRRANLAALGWAVQLQRGVVGGSDGHQLKRLGSGVTAAHATTVEEFLDAIRDKRASVHGLELRPAQRVFDYANTSVKTKIKNGVAGGLKKGFAFPMKASRRIIDELKR